MPRRQSCFASPTRRCSRWSARILAAAERAWAPPYGRHHHCAAVHRRHRSTLGWSLPRAGGRQPISLIGFGSVLVRGALFAVGQSPLVIIAAQTLDGIVGAIVTVMTVLAITDLITGTGRFNFAHGAVGTCTGIAAAVSTTVAGVIAGSLGREAAFLATAGVAALAALMAVFAGKQAERISRIEISRSCN